MKRSARNALKGTVTSVTMGQTTATVIIDVNGTQVTASITKAAVDDLGLKPGMEATAIIKSSDVIIAVA